MQTSGPIRAADSAGSGGEGGGRRAVSPGEVLHVSDGVGQRHSVALGQQETQQPRQSCEASHQDVRQRVGIASCGNGSQTERSDSEGQKVGSICSLNPILSILKEAHKFKLKAFFLFCFWQLGEETAALNGSCE